MIRPQDVRVWAATMPVDMRKSFDSLAEVVRAFLGHDPLCGHLLVFRYRSAERVKILWWDKTGLAIFYMRLERGTFPFPESAEKSVAITGRQGRAAAGSGRGVSVAAAAGAGGG